MASIFSKPSIFKAGSVEPRAPVPKNIDRQAQMAAIAEAESVMDIGKRRALAKEELSTDSAALRNRLASKSQSRRLKAYEEAFMQTDPESPEVPILVEAAYREAEQIPENRAPTSIEEGYVDTVESQREDSLLEGSMFEGDYREEQRLVTIRREQVNNILAGWAEERERRPAAWWFVERLGFQGIPGAVSSQQTGMTSEATVGENLFAGERIVQEAREFQRAMATLPDEEWQPYLDNLVNEILERTSASGLADLTAREDILGELLDPLPPEIINTFNFMDNILPFVGPLVSGSARTVSTTAAATRRVNRVASTRASVESLSAQRVGQEGIVPADELATEVLPRIVNPEPDGVSAAGVIVRDVEPIDELTELLESQRLFDDEIDAAYDAAESALIQRYGGPRLTDIQRVQTNLRTGQAVRDVEGILVRPNGSAYKTEQTAGLAAQRMGLSPDDVIDLGTRQSPEPTSFDDFVFQEDFRAAHRGDAEEFVDPENVSFDRYDFDGGTFGGVLYLDESGDWISGSKFSTSSERIVGVELANARMFALTPESLPFLKQRMSVDTLDSPTQVSDFLREEGFDGFTIRGFDDARRTARNEPDSAEIRQTRVLPEPDFAEEDAFLEGLGLGADGTRASALAEDQVVILNPKKVRVVEERDASEITETIEDPEIGMFSNIIDEGFRDRFLRESGSVTRASEAAGIIGPRKNSGQGWGIRVSSPVDESSFFTTPLELTSRNAIGRLFSSGELRLGDLGATEAHRAQGRLNRIEETLVRPVNQAVRKLSRGERTSLQSIWNKGASEGRWFNRQEFDEMYLRASSGAKPSERAWSAYQQIIRVNNIEHSIRNDALFAELQTQGVRSIDIEAPFINRGTWNGRVISKPPQGARVFNAETGELLDEFTEVPEGFQLVALRSGPSEVSVNGHPLNHVLIRKTNMAERALDLNQLNYKPGGHRFYDANYWVRRGTDELTRPVTYIAGRTRAEVRKWADVMENGRLEFNRLVREEGVTEDIAADRVVEEFFGDSKAFPNRDEFLADMQRDADSSFQVTLDREMPRGEPGSGFGEASPLETHLSRQGRMYHSRRGEQAVRDYMGEEAFVTDLGDVLGRSLTNVARIAGYGDFKMQMVNRWIETYSDILPRAVEGESNMGRFLRGLDGAVENVDQRVLESARAQHDAIKTALGFRDDSTIRMQVMQRQLTDWVADQNWLRGMGIKDPVKFAGDMNDWLRTTNPQAALMGAAFDLKLGLFNIAQIPLQMTHFAVMWQLSKSGAGFNAGAFANSMPAFVYATNRGNPEGILDSLVSTGMHKTLGMDEAEYRQMMQMMRASGKIDVNGRYLAIAELGTDINPAAGTGLGRRIRDLGRTPFSATESSMRASAFMMAWRETRKLFPDAAVGSRRFQDEVLNRQRKLTFSMDGELPAAWQKGAAAVPTQFWGYFTRMNEAMFSGKFGALLRNDAGQLSVNTPRMRLLVGQSFLYGPLAGLPLMNLLPWASEKVGLTEPASSAADLGTIEGFVDRGFIDHVYRWSTGKDVLVSQRYAAGTFAGDFLRSLFGESAYGGVTAGEVLGGASVSIGADVFGDATEFMGDMVNYMRRAAHGNVEGVSVPRESFMRMMANVSMVNNATRAIMIRNFGILQSSNQTPLVTGLDPSYSIEALFSLQPEQMRELSQNFKYLEDREAAISDIADVINRYNIMALEDPDRIPELNNELGAFISLIHSEDPGLVIEALPRTTESRLSLFDYTQQRVQRATRRDQLNEALQDG